MVNTSQRPKVEAYEGVLYVVVRQLEWEEGGALLGEQMSSFVGADFVISLQERPGDAFDPVRRRIRTGRTWIRSAGPDYLAYALIDAVVDAYFPLLQAFGEKLEGLEEEVLSHPTRAAFDAIRRARRDLIAIRRAVWPLRDAAMAMQSDVLTAFRPETRAYLRDLFDHTMRIVDLVESYREVLGGLTDGYVTAASFRTNEVVAVLTIFGTIFLPLTFLTSLYGMNFDRTASPWNMPELGFRYGYPALLVVMGLMALGMVVFFWRRGWLFRAESVTGRDGEGDDGAP